MKLPAYFNHLLWLGAHAYGYRCYECFLYCFQEREHLLDCYEAVSGARMHRLPIIGQVVSIVIYRNACHNILLLLGYRRKHLTRKNLERQGSLLDFIESFTQRFPKIIDEYETLLTDNPLWKQRT